MISLPAGRRACPRSGSATAGRESSTPSRGKPSAICTSCCGCYVRPSQMSKRARSAMPKPIGIALVLALAAGYATAQPAATTTAAPAGDAKQLNVDSPVDDILDALDARGKDLKDFTAAVTLTDTDI